MGTLADSLFNVLMSWVRALVNGFWALFDADHTTILELLGKNWMWIAGIIIAAGIIIDWIVWMMRWKPYHNTSRRMRRALHLSDEEDEEEEDVRHLRAHAALRREPPRRQEEPEEEEAQTGLPARRPSADEAAAALSEAASVPDEELGAYPGMRYGAQAAPREDLGETQRYSAVHSEGPGAAEVERRRAEIDAWQQQMQEEARQKAEAERAAREAERQRLAQEAYEAEQQRLAQEAYEAEQQRLAQEAYEAEQQRLAQEACEAEQQRLAQEAYEREMAEYREKQAQYEREMAEYQRQMAAYQEQMQQEKPAVSWPDDGVRQSRRNVYSSYAPETAVEQLPDPPQWPQMDSIQKEAARAGRKKKPREGAGLMNRMAKMMESEEVSEISPIQGLPPRVDPHEAYRPAQKPPRPGTRKN